MKTALPLPALRSILVLAGVAVGLAGCQLPDISSRNTSVFMEPSTETRLGQAIQRQAAEHPGKSGIFSLQDGQDSFAARMLLAQAAERSLDVQYYIWHTDISGSLLLTALKRAADRGVRVRLLLDDINTKGLDSLLAELDGHPNVEVRLYNPFKRPHRIFGYMFDFGRINRRMHNKSFTADSQATIVGGRNIADQYFGAATDRDFIDLDVLAVGPIAEDVSRDFDRYWASESAYPADLILKPDDDKDPSQHVSAVASMETTAAAEPYLRAVKDRPFVTKLVSGDLALEWVPTRLISDSPAKTLGTAEKGTLFWPQLIEAMGPPQHEVDMVSPYFVPTEVAVDSFRKMTQRGVTVRVLTNSFAATDAAIVHSGYSKWRKKLLEDGVKLYEMKRTAGILRTEAHLAGSGSSQASLHAKTFSVDGQRVFIGSLNFDPRSAFLNTELGVVIHSAPLAESIEAALAAKGPEGAYQVRLEDGKMQWIERVDGNEVIHLKEPGTSSFSRFKIWFFSLMPIDWLL